MIKVIDDRGGLICGGEICKGKSSENPVVKMVVESIR